MSNQVRGLEPKSLWQNFADLNSVPRPSKKEARVIKFIQSFGENLKLPVFTDEAGNVIIKKPATKGFESLKTVVLQSHLDMVHQKNSDTKFDFETQGIDMFIDGDWVKAKGTTLGADNGIGVAAIMALLQSTDIEHPALEALFTIDEETGMTGALALKGGLLEGQFMLNLDTENDRELTIGCAGGIDVTATGSYALETPKNTEALRLHIKGLTGGHSGMDIHLGRANANKLMNRILLLLVNNFGAEVSHIEGGSLRNAIPRESFAIITIPSSQTKACNDFLETFKSILKSEYHTTDPTLVLEFEAVDLPAKTINHLFLNNILRALYACPNGIYRMSPDISGLVQTSNNVAKVVIKDGKYQVQCLSRSSVNSEKTDLQMAITSAFELCGASVQTGGEYPGWTPAPKSDIVQLMTQLYKEKYKEDPHVSAVHAGLECGILGRNYPNMQMISFGPNITGAHSPDERVQISSVQKFWNFLLAVLKNIPINT